MNSLKSKKSSWGKHRGSSITSFYSFFDIYRGTVVSNIYRFTFIYSLYLEGKFSSALKYFKRWFI